MSKKKFDRIHSYNRICELTGLSPSKKTRGYFRGKQMTELELWIERNIKKESAECQTIPR
jgi:hypothetical protein